MSNVKRAISNKHGIPQTRPSNKDRPSDRPNTEPHELPLHGDPRTALPTDRRATPAPASAPPLRFPNTNRCPFRNDNDKTPKAPKPDTDLPLAAGDKSPDLLPKH